LYSCRSGAATRYAGPGGIGFWTKADAATSFDDLVINK
jgi:hypothetical protein